MNDIAATIGLVNLGSVVERALDACLNNAYAYDHALRDIGSDHLHRPGMNSSSAWWLYTVQVQDRAAFQTFMARRGIETSEVHRRNDRVAAFAAIAGPTAPGDFPGLDRFAAAQVSVPVGWWLTKPQRDVVANALVDFAQRGG
jgi:dTDP-4-amino-4,6-dideoxygalactose transaminase